MKYRYKVIGNGEVIEDVVEMNSEREVEEFLRSRGYSIIKIEGERESISINGIFKRSLSNRELSILLMQMSVMTNAGVNTIEMLDILRSENRTYLKIFTTVLNSLREGNSLSESLKISGAFPKIVHQLVRVGENTGNLGVVFKSLSNHYRNLDKFNKKVISAITYPIFLIIVTVVILNFTMVSIIPKYVDVFQGRELPLPTRVLIGISNFFTKYNLFILLGTVIIFGIILVAIKKNNRIYYLLNKNKTYKKIYHHRFVTYLSLMLKNGVQILDTIEIIGEVLGNPVLNRKLVRVSMELKQGSSLRDGLGAMGFFDEVLLSVVKVGEETYTLGSSLESLIDYYEYDIENSSERFIALLGPILIVILAIIVGGVVISIAMPMFEMIDPKGGYYGY